MTHFRGQIRGPHWGPTMDNLLIDFWRQHECLFNSSADSYYDKDLKTKLWTEFALSIGKPVSDVERRSRSLRTQYGRVLWHPERVNTAQQKMLREKLDFLRPYIVRRRGDSTLEEQFDDREEDNDDEEPETGEGFDQDLRSSFTSLLDADVSVTSTPNPAPLHCPNPPPQVTEVITMSCPHPHYEGPTDQPDQTAAPSTSRHDILNQFAEVMLADMRQIKDPMVLMRLRRDITDLVFKAAEQDAQRRCARVLGQSMQSCSRPQQPYLQTNFWRQRFLKRKNRGCELARRMQRWEEVKHTRRVSRSQWSQAAQQSQAVEGIRENSSQVVIQASEVKREAEPHIIKVEEEVPPVV
ncbi:uncharacterized protein LOC113173009 [Anabas testudineus]|uniref:uncharacterized protein LOC113173009 n=1 Tax=Anabas testudineus TaxID=64144 RepID=UPI000E46317B|nr:uncharacterized protein LOC113173009 [Anabas testudineus]